MGQAIRQVEGVRLHVEDVTVLLESRALSLMVKRERASPYRLTFLPLRQLLNCKNHRFVGCRVCPHAESLHPAFVRSRPAAYH